MGNAAAQAERSAESDGEEGVASGIGSSLGPVLDLMRLFWGLDHSMQLASKGLVSRVGLTEPQRQVLSVVEASPGISVGEVAERQHWHSATVTGIAQRLERRGILSRKTDSRDRRRKKLFVTSKGRRLLQSGGSTVNGAVGQALASVPTSAVAAAEAVLVAVTRELDALLPGH